MTQTKLRADGTASRSTTLFRSIWRYFPIWFIYLMGLGLMHYEIANVPPERYQQAGHDARWFAAMVIVPE